MIQLKGYQLWYKSNYTNEKFNRWNEGQNDELRKWFYQSMTFPPFDKQKFAQFL